MMLTCTICKELVSDPPFNYDDSDIIALDEGQPEEAIPALKEVTVTECGHVFHSDCITKWSDQRSRNSPPKCPVCRSDLHMNNCLRLFLSRDYEANFSKSMYEFHEKTAILESSVTDLKEQLESRDAELQIARSELKALGDEVGDLKEEITVRDATLKNWEDIASRLQVDSNDVFQEIQSAFNQTNSKQLTPSKVLNSTYSFAKETTLDQTFQTCKTGETFVDENSNLTVQETPSAAAKGHNKRRSRKKKSEKSDAAIMLTAVRTNALFGITLNLRHAFEKLGEDIVVTELKMLVLIESEGTETGISELGSSGEYKYSTVKNAVMCEISKQSKYVELMEILKERATVIVKERIYLYRLQRVYREVFSS